ncbi:MAG TPA: carbohydrate porin [Stellaceae bacterium]|nr:carbohydrate porin [Stellaceae bacterium]
MRKPVPAASTVVPSRKTGFGLLVALALTLGTPAAFAAEPGQADPGTADTADAPETPIEPVQAEPVEAEPTLLGDLGGLRPALAKHGIELDLSYIGEAFGVVHGSVKRGAIYEGQAGIGLGIDLEKMVGWPGAKAYANALQIHGRGASDRLLGDNLMTVSNIEARPTTRLYQLWFEQGLFEDRASLRLGQLAGDEEFIVSETASGLINGTFGWPLLTAANVRGGGPAYPLPQPGIRLQVKPAADVTLRAAAFSGNPGGRNCPSGDPQECDPHGVKFPLSGGTFWIAEGEYAVNSGKGAAGLPGTYKLGAWHETGNFPNQFSGALDRRGNWGIYAIADQAVWRRPGSDEQGLNLFARIGGAPSDRNVISFYADAGIGFRAPFASRPDDVVTLGAAFGKISSDAARADRLAGPPAPVRDYEAVIELSYKAAVLPGWSVQPDLQYIIHPGGNVAHPNRPEPIPNALVLGLRTTLAF